MANAFPSISVVFGSTASGLRPPVSAPRTLQVALLKPTRLCNADCAYCCSPPQAIASPAWTDPMVLRIAQFLAARAVPGVSLNVIWHGGEPMLLSPSFYRRAFALFTEAFAAAGALFHFSIQTNLLRYGPKWRSLFSDSGLFGGRVSTSYEPYGTRTVQGSVERYDRLFAARFTAALDDGLEGFVIATLSGPLASATRTAHALYDWSLQRYRATGRGFAVRLNYRTATGRALAMGDSLLTPRQYGELVLEVADRWLADGEPFDLVPVTQMALSKRTVSGFCPWTDACGGTFLAIEPSGDLFNCTDFADLDDPTHVFGNIFNVASPEPLASPAARRHRRRALSLPAACRACPHLAACHGGCHRDSVAAGRGFGGHFPHCDSWTLIFDWIDAHPDLRTPPAPPPVPHCAA